MRPANAQLLRAGTDVRERGVVIGKVSNIRLMNRHAELTLQIDSPYRIPNDVTAAVDLKTLLGDKYVDLRSPTFGPPWLSDNARIQGTVGPELEAVVQSGTQIFGAISPSDLAAVIGNLAQGAQGHGMDVRQGIEANATLSTIFAKTLAPQLRGLHDFDVIFGALKDKGVDLNRLADAVNQGAPVYASARAHRLLHQALTAIVPSANNLADLLINQKPLWDQMIDSGDKVLQTVALRPAGLHQLIHGLYMYVLRLGGRPPTLPDGSAEAPFSNFSGGTSFQDTLHSLCGSLPAPIKHEIPICGQARYAR